MKTYVLMLSEYFPASHPCKGNKTHFYDKIMAGKKLHTIRANPELWAKRAIEVREGRAQISVRQWTGKPYQTKQIELFRLGTMTEFKFVELIQHPIYYCLKYRFVSIESLKDINEYDFTYFTFSEELSQNDGLTEQQFCDWFNPKHLEDFQIKGTVIYFNDILK